MVRNALRFVSYRDRKKVATDLKAVYQAPTEEAGLEMFSAFEEKWNGQYPMIAKSWKANWMRLRTFWDFPAAIRKIIYTTNSIESLNFQLRKVTKNRGSFPNDDAAIKLLYMALKNIMRKWTMPVQNWANAINQLSIIFPERISVNEL